jgi:uncharacterized protein YeeX (DUF496 family)
VTSLYHLTKDFQSLQKLGEEDMPLEAIQDTLEAIGGEFEDKAVNVIKYSMGVEGDIKNIDDEIARLREIKTRKAKHVASLRDYLRDNMTVTGITKISCPLFSITLGKPTTKVDIVSEQDLPDEYVDLKTVITPNKRLILADLKAGKEIPGAGLIEGQARLLIK